MRVWGRTWGGLLDTSGYVLYTPDGEPLLPAEIPIGSQNSRLNGKGKWVARSTDSSGNNDLLYLTALCCALQLNLNESPRYANVGVAVADSIASGVPPDIQMARIQRRYAPYFGSLVITRTSSKNGSDPPTYSAQVVTHTGVAYSARRPIPQ